MARLFLVGDKIPYRQPDGKIIASKERVVRVTTERLHEALRRRLSSKYRVFKNQVELGRGAKVRKDAFMSIVVSIRPKGDGTEFITKYDFGSHLLGVPLMLMLIPLIFFWRMSRSPARYELEAEVIEALKDEWPELQERD